MSEESGFPHLAPQTVKVLADSKEERIKYLYTDWWIPYAAAKAILDDISGILSRPRSPRAECRIVVSSSNNGKSRIAQKFHKEYPATFDESTGVTRVPIIYIPTLAGPDPVELFTEILRCVFIPYRASDKPKQLRDRVHGIIEDLDVRMLLLDEFNVVATKSGKKQREFLTELRALAVHQRLSIICFTTKEGVTATQYDEAFQNRFPIYALPQWTMGIEWKTMLAKLEGLIPLPEPSKLSADKFATILLDESEGKLGELRSLLIKMAQYAISHDLPCLDAKNIVTIGWTKPSLRRLSIDQLRG